MFLDEVDYGVCTLVVARVGRGEMSPVGFH